MRDHDKHGEKHTIMLADADAMAAELERELDGDY